MSLLSTLLIALLAAGIGSAMVYFLWDKKTQNLRTSLENRLEALEQKQEQARKDMQKALKEIQEMNSLLQASLQEIPGEAAASPVPGKPASSGFKEFYMAIPNRDGSFHAQAYSATFKPTVSLYRFKEIAEGKAEFEFYPDEGGLRDALNFSSAYLEPACEELNDIRPDSKTVLTLEKGLAERIDNRWVILRKTKIRYQ